MNNLCSTLPLTATPEGQQPSGGLSPEVAMRLERIEALLVSVVDMLHEHSAPTMSGLERNMYIRDLARKVASGDKGALKEHNRRQRAMEVRHEL